VDKERRVAGFIINQHSTWSIFTSNELRLVIVNMWQK